MDIKLGKKHFFKNHICDGFFYLFHIERPITRYSIARLKGLFCRAGHISTPKLLNEIWTGL